MIYKYDVQADHPTLKRVDKHGLSIVSRNNLLKELRQAGYENIQYFRQLYYQVGDVIEVTKEMIDGKPKEVKKRLGYILVDAVSNFGELSGDATEFWAEKMLPIQVKLHAERFDRFRVAMMCEWVGVTEKYKTNTMLLEELGFRFDHSYLENIEPIPIEECDDEYLTEKEIVVKYYAKEHGLSIKEAWEEIEKVVDVMSKNGIIFYRP